MEKAECRTCRFRDPDPRPEYEGAGQCRRYPPTVAEQVTFDGSGNNHFSQLWPWMHATDWCGEFQPAQQLANPPVNPPPTNPVRTITA